MKRKILVPLMAILVIGIVSAGIGLDALDKTRTLEKAQRDMLLSKTEEATINPDVEITYNGEYYLWSAVQEGVINSHHNRMEKDYCSETNETSGECITYTDYTDAEIQDMVADAVQAKLSNYANAEISRANNPQADWGTGNVEIIEKK